MKSSQKKPKKCFDDCDADSFKLKKLPENFAETVLNLELDIEQPEISLEAVNQLIELYACAVEYYESIHSDRFLIFQNKMRNLLLKPTVVNIMERSSPGLKKSESQTPELIKIQKLKEHEMNFLLVKQQVDNQKVMSILKDETKKFEDINILLKSETIKQEDDIMKRLMNRKNKKVNDKSQKENMIDNIVNIVKKNEPPLNAMGRRTSRSLDTNSLEREYYGTEEKGPGNESPNVSEQRKKSIAMMKRASKDLTKYVEKRMSKLSVMEIEQAVQINRVNSVKKHMKKAFQGGVVVEEVKNADIDSSESDDDESLMEKSNTSLQSPPNDGKKDDGLLKLKVVGESKSSLKKKKETTSIKSTTFQNEENKKNNVKNKTSAEDEAIEKNQNLKEEYQKNTNPSEPLKMESEVKAENAKKDEDLINVENEKIEKGKINEDYLKDQEEIKKKFSDKISILENQINSNGGQSKLIQKMLEQVKKEQHTEIEKLNKKFNIESPTLEKTEPKKNESDVHNEHINSGTEINANSEKKDIHEEEKKEKGDDPEEARIKKMEKEKDEKIKFVLSKFGNQINQLETQLKQNKSGGGLISKLLEKLKKEELNQMEAINKDYEEKLNLKS